MRKRLISTLAAVVSVAFLVTTIGCEKGEKGAVPSSAEKRLQQTTQTLPADTSFAYVMSDLANFRKSAKESKKTLSRLFPIEDALEEVKETEAGSKLFGDEGVKIFKKEFWKKSGIAPDSAFTLAMVDYNTVALTYVADKKKFEKDLLSDLETDGDPSSEKIAGKDANVVKTKKGKVYWNYRGKLATVVFPEGDEAAQGDAETPPTKATLEKLLKTKKKDSLFKSSGFTNFRNAAGEQASLLYAQLTPHLKRGILEGGDEEINKKLAKSVEESLDGFGFVLETEKNRIKGRMWVGLTETGKKNFEKLFKSPVKADWSKFATEKTLVALRSAGNWKGMWDSLTSSMPEKEVKQMEQGLAMAKKSSGIDIEKDVLANLTGQAGILVYGIGGKATPELMGNPMAALGKLEAMYMMKFGDADALGKVTEKVAGMSEEYFTLRNLQPEGGDAVKSIQVLEITPPKRGMIGMMMGGMQGSDEAPVRFYVHEDTLALATTSIPEKSIQSLLTGEGEGSKSLADSSDLDLGAKFANSKDMSGLYVNFNRFRDIFGDMVSKLPMASLKNSVDTLEEGLLSQEGQENGVFVDVTIDLLPEGKGGEK